MAPSLLGRVDGFLAVAHSRFLLIYLQMRRELETGDPICSVNHPGFSLCMAHRDRQICYSWATFWAGPETGSVNRGLCGQRGSFQGWVLISSGSARQTPIGVAQPSARDLEFGLHTATINIKGSRHGRKERLSKAEVYWIRSARLWRRLGKLKLSWAGACPETQAAILHKQMTFEFCLFSI